MKALLLDLGGVIIDVDPRGCFEHWASAAGVDAALLARRWRVDDAYEALEVGAIDFAAYAERLSSRLGITLGEEDWRGGWNALLREPFPAVVAALPSVAARIPLYCFSNTNAVHQAVWERRFAKALEPFRKIYTSWQLGERKPNPRAYRRVADDIGVAPADILFLDDNRDNVAGAEAAGMSARHVTSPDDTLEVLRKSGLHDRSSLAK